MPTITEEILQRVIRIETILTERCEDHQRQLDAQQKQIDGLKRRNGNGRPSSSWADPKVITTIVVAAAGIITGILALLGVKL
jgi:hypothetical protein